MYKEIDRTGILGIHNLENWHDYEKLSLSISCIWDGLTKKLEKERACRNI